jgi:glyoxylase-like metal-dependent hydrolase (beta-lactamase superfamily II)
MPYRSIDATTWFYDTEYQGHRFLIATGVLETEAGLLLIDPGPTPVLDTLETKLEEDGFSWEDVHAVLLTHIHLDHAGASGSLVERAPHVQVAVHERGARHMVNPERLLRSARRIYGDRMEALWGAFLPVPEANVKVLSGDETLTFGTRTLDVTYTPGHAQHHVSYFDEASGTAFIGDVGGMRVTGADYVLPVMPPPDVDLAAWTESLDRVRAWSPARLFLTHFGPHNDVKQHLEQMDARVDAFAQSVRAMLDAADDEDDERLARRFAAQELDRMQATTDERFWTAYEQFGQPRDSWYGLARYWRKQS